MPSWDLDRPCRLYLGLESKVVFLDLQEERTGSDVSSNTGSVLICGRMVEYEYPFNTAIHGDESKSFPS